MRRFVNYSALLLALLLCTHGFSQSDSLLDVSLQEISIVGHKDRILTPLNDLSSAHTLRVIPSFSIHVGLNDILQRWAGVWVANEFNQAQDVRIAMRGIGTRSAFGIRGIRIIMDDFPETTPDGQGQVDNLDYNAIYEVSSHLGLAGGQWGNASGGVLHFRTIPTLLGQDTLMTTLSHTFGEYGMSQWHASHMSGGHTNGIFLSMTSRFFEGFRPQSRSANHIFNGAWHKIIRPKVLLKVLANVGYSPYAEDPGAYNVQNFLDAPFGSHPSNVTYDAGEKVYQHRWGFILDYTINERHKLKSKAYTTYRMFDGRLPFQAGGWVQFNRYFNGINTEWIWHTKKGFDVYLGADVEWQSDFRQRFFNNNGIKGDVTLRQLERVVNPSMYMTIATQWSEKWSGTIGGRFDHALMRIKDDFFVDGDQSLSQNYAVFNPFADISYAQSHLDMKIHFGASTEWPLFTEIVNNVVVDSADILKTQKTVGISYEVSTSIVKRINVNTGVFYYNTTGEPTPFELENMPGRTYYKNAGQIIRYGMEWMVNYEWLNHIKCVGSLTIGRYFFGHKESSNKSTVGNALPGMPQHQSYLGIERLSGERVLFSLGWRYGDRQFLDDTNKFQAERQNLLQGMVGFIHKWRRQSVMLTLHCFNIGNVLWVSNIRPNAFAGRYFEAGMPRQWTISVKYQRH